MRKSVYILLNSNGGTVEFNCKLPIKEIVKDGISLFHMGNFYYENAACDNTRLLELYQKYGSETYLHLDGVGTLFAIDNNKKKIFVQTDLFNSCTPVYLHKNNNEFIVSNELKTILLNSNSEFNFDNDAVDAFMEKGFVVGEKTLIKEIKKLPGKHNLEIDFDGNYRFVPQVPLDSVFKKKDVSVDSYNATVDKIAKSLLRDKYALPLSSGFDTNLLLHHIHNNIDKSEILDSFCIGGRIGWNEIEQSRANADFYGYVNLHWDLVGGDTFELYPEIVKMLEGAIYEHGIFLQFCLARLAKSVDCERIILGECADQVLDYELWHPEDELYLEKRSEHKERSDKQRALNIATLPYKDVYEMATCKINKKSGIMLNCFGVETEYPYLRRDFCEQSFSVAKKGDKLKTYHKQVVFQTLPHEVTDAMSKKPGATELRTLFIGDIKYEDVVEFAKKSPFYREVGFDDDIYEIHYYMKLMYLELFREIFLKESGRKWLTDEEKMPKLQEFMK